MIQLLFFLSIIMMLANALPDHYNIAVMFPIVTSDHQPHIAGNLDAAAIFMAFDAINNKTDGIADDLLPNIELRMVARSPLSSFSNGAVMAVDILEKRYQDQIIACIGPYGLESSTGL